MLIRAGGCPLIQVPAFMQESWLCHGFGFQGITIEDYAEALQLSRIRFPKIDQRHTDQILFDAEEGVGDARVTDRPNLLLHVRTADCLPVLVADTEHRAVAVVHAGWRGTATRLVQKTLRAMKERYGTDFSKVKVAIGPAIGGREYQVGIEVVKTFEKAGLYPAPWCQDQDRDHWHLDLAYATRFLLRELGVHAENIYLSLACTKSDPRFASFRREGENRGEQVHFILIRS